MPPLPPPETPRIVLYYQTHHTPLGRPISILPLLTTPNTTITHLILAALHLNGSPGDPLSRLGPNTLTLNDHPPSHPRNATLWAELSCLRASGIKVLGMLGGAARGTFALLDSSLPEFEAYYSVLHDFVKEKELDGLDLDVEEEMSLDGIVRLVDRLKEDFGEGFVITLAPVAAALLDERRNLSGFDYAELEIMRGSRIAWYNAQFYCGWGEMWTGVMYDTIIARGWAPGKIVAGLVTNSENGAGWVPFIVLKLVLSRLRSRYGDGFGGVMGWEYFNSLPGGKERPWEWAGFMTRVLREKSQMLTQSEVQEAEKEMARMIEEGKDGRRRAAEGQEERKAEEERRVRESMVDLDKDIKEEAEPPGSFEYLTDESLE